MPIYKVEIIPNSYIFNVSAESGAEAKKQAKKYLEAGAKYEEGEGKTLIIGRDEYKKYSPRYYKPVKLRGRFGVVLFDDHGNEIDEKERGLTEKCPEGKQHDWLLLPKEEGQKQYLYCLKCHNYSHT